MTSCKEISELATAYREGGLEPAIRRAYEVHLAGCPGCRAFDGQLQVTARAVAALPPPELPAALQQRLLAAFDARQAALRQAPARAPAAPPGARWHAWEAVFGVAGVAALLVGLARHPSHAVADWIVAAALAAGAMAFAALVRRLTVRFAAAALSAALVAAALRGVEGPLAGGTGLDCLLTELGAAAVVTGVGWLASRRTGGLAALGGWAVAGALAGDAALQIACAERTSLPHLLAFHAGGVLLVAAAVLLLTRRPALTA